MSESGHIFISYRSIEADFALKLAADLKNAGVNLWMDRLDGIQGGDDWRRSIQNALNNCGALIAVLSPDYVEADYCQNELARADTLKRPIFPVLLRSVPDADWPLVIQRLQYVDFRNCHDEKIYKQKLAELLRTLPSTQKSVPPDKETQYLTSLIAELESRKGVLEYVELSAKADEPKEVDPVRPEPHREDEWAAGFSLLVERKDVPPVIEMRPEMAPAIGSPPIKIHFDSITEAVKKYPRFVLIGEPGAGKTTTIRRLAVNAARRRLDNPRTAPIPLLLYLPQWNSEPTPLDFVREQWPFKTDPFTLLATGDILLYLDGLNELGGTGPEKAEKLRNWLHGERAPQRVIVTCRVEDYASDLDLELPRVQAEELDGEKIERFSKNYLKENAESFLRRVLPQDKEVHENSRSLFRLVRNPYLLAALIFVFDNGPNHDLPRNNGALMRGLARALWERERLKRTPGWISFEEMGRRFGKLAFVMIDDDKPIDVSLEYALKYIGDKALLRTAGSANLIEIRGNEVRFYHQLMQEYFAGLELEGRRNNLEDLLGHAEWGLWGRKTNRWHQVIIASCGFSSYADAIIEEVARIDCYIAADCILKGNFVSSKTYEVVVRTVLGNLGSLEWGRRASLAEILPQIVDKRAISELLNALKNPSSYVRLNASKAFQVIGSEALPYLLSALNDSDSLMRASAANTLGIIGNEEIASKLSKLLFDPDIYVSSYAIEALGKLRNHAVVPQLIKKLSDTENPYRSPNMRICDYAAEALIHIGTAEALEAVKAWRRNQLKT